MSKRFLRVTIVLTLILTTLLIISYVSNRGNSALAATPPGAIIERWEYKFFIVVMGDGQKRCNDLGLDGWELVNVENYNAYFKRRLP